jgi:CubicO group peptidase (beta-lactamase class C family)
MKKLIFQLLLIVIACAPVAAQRAYNIKGKIKEARSAVSKMVTEQNIPGLSVTITKKGSTVWSEGFGYADLENKVRVQPGETRFRIGSVSKPLTAHALALLFEQGKLNLDAEIQEYVPYFPRKKYPITIRQVAGHIAGIRHYKGQENFSKERYNSVKAGLRIFQNDSLLFQPGTSYQYSSYGWNLLSAVVEGASGQDFLPFMQQNVFNRLGMSKTVADHIDSIIPGRTRYYEYSRTSGITNSPYVDNSYKWAGGGFLSTSEDIARFANAHLHSGYLKATTLSAFTKSQTLSNGQETGYGIGWASGRDVWNRYYFGHTGGSVGGITMMRIYPEEKLVIVILTNSSNVSNSQLTAVLANIFSDELSPAPEIAKNITSLELEPCSKLNKVRPIESNTRFTLFMKNEQRYPVQLFFQDEQGNLKEDYTIKPGQWLIKSERRDIQYVIRSKKQDCVGQFSTAGNDSVLLIK